MKKFLLCLFLSLVLIVVSPAGSIKPPDGFHGKVYNASMALYASSKERGINSKFICTVTAYKKIDGGYLLIGAGHCTPANEDLPKDMTFGVADNIGEQVHPVVLLHAVMNEPLDYAIYFYPTRQKFSTIDLGNEAGVKVGDKTVDVNFSLGAAKIVSEGVVSSVVIEKGAIAGFYLDNQFDSHGASGSAIVSEKSHKIIGLVIAGWDGATMPSIIEPISTVEALLSKLDINALIHQAALQNPPNAPITPAGQFNPVGIL